MRCGLTTTKTTTLSRHYRFTSLRPTATDSVVSLCVSWAWPCVLQQRLIRSTCRVRCVASYVSCQHGTARIRPVARRCCWAPLCSNRSISPAWCAHSSKPAASACCGLWDRQRTDGQTDTVSLHGPCRTICERAVSVTETLFHPFPFYLSQTTKVHIHTHRHTNT